MRKTVSIMVAISVICLTAICTQKAIAAQKAKAAVPAAGVEKQWEPIALDGKQWDIEYYASSAKEVKMMPDKITFRKGQFTSDRYAAQGYASTNYTLAVKEDGTTTFDTMQSSPKGIVSWHGEVKRDVLTVRGVISEKPANAAKSIDYNFGGTRWIEVPNEAPAEEAAVSAVTEAAPAAAVKEEAPKAPAKKAAPEKTEKKSWF